MRDNRWSRFILNNSLTIYYLGKQVLKILGDGQYFTENENLVKELLTNSLLAKWIVRKSCCSYCGYWDENLLHFFIDCPLISF